jgi:acetylornithine deacetylase/succinyl-diaminopimelate desuccinylase-like protein
MEGGGTVNSIASQAGALFEFRSESAANLKRMEGLFRAALDSCRRDGVDIEVETIGVRPGNGPVDARRLAALAKRSADTIRSVTGRDVDASPASTDANIPLSLGIPSICVGAVRGSLLHTRDEWVDLASLEDGLALVLSLMLQASDAL